MTDADKCRGAFEKECQHLSLETMDVSFSNEATRIGYVRASTQDLWIAFQRGWRAAKETP